MALTNTVKITRKMLPNEKKVFVGRFIAPGSKSTLRRRPILKKGRMEKVIKPKKGDDEHKKRDKGRKRRAQAVPRPKPKDMVEFRYIEADIAKRQKPGKPGDDLQALQYLGARERPQTSCSYVVFEVNEGGSGVTVYPVELVRFTVDTELKNSAPKGEKPLTVDELEKAESARHKEFKKRVMKRKRGALRSFVGISDKNDEDEGRATGKKKRGDDDRDTKTVDDFLSVTRLDSVRGDKEGQIEEAPDFLEALSDDEVLQQNDAAPTIESDSSDSQDDGMEVNVTFGKVHKTEGFKAMRGLLHGKSTKKKEEDSSDDGGEDLGLTENDISDYSDSDTEMPKKRARTDDQASSSSSVPGPKKRPATGVKTIDKNRVVGLFKRYGRMTTGQFLNRLGAQLNSPGVKSAVVKILKDVTKMVVDPSSGKKFLHLKEGM